MILSAVLNLRRKLRKWPSFVGFHCGSSEIWSSKFSHKPGCWTNRQHSYAEIWSHLRSGVVCATMMSPSSTNSSIGNGNIQEQCKIVNLFYSDEQVERFRASRSLNIHQVEGLRDDQASAGSRASRSHIGTAFGLSLTAQLVDATTIREWIYNYIDFCFYKTALVGHFRKMLPQGIVTTVVCFVTIQFRLWQHMWFGSLAESQEVLICSTKFRSEDGLAL